MSRKFLFSIISLMVIYLFFSPARNTLAGPGSQLDDPGFKCNLGAMMIAQGQVGEAWSLIEEGFTALNANPQADPYTLAACALNMSALRQSAGDLNGALQSYSIALTKAQAIKDNQLIWTGLYGIGSVYMAQGRYEEAQQNFEIALPLSQDKRCWQIPQLKRLAEGVTLNNLGVVKGVQIEYQAARGDLEQALEIMRELAQGGNALGSDCAAGGFDPLGLVLQLTGIIPQMGLAFEPLVLSNLGETYRSEGQYEPALKTLKEALVAVQQSGQSPMMAGVSLSIEGLIYNNLGLTYYNQGNLADALSNYEQAIAVMRRLNHRSALAGILTNTAAIKTEQGQLEAALADYEEAMGLIDKIRQLADSRLTNIVAEGGLGTSNAYALGGSTEEFRDVYALATELYHQVGQDNLAFYTAERGRARLLLEMLLRNQLEVTDPAAAALIEQERRADAKVQALEDALAQSQIFSATNPSLVPAAEASLAESQDAYNELLSTIRANGNEIVQLLSGQDNLLTLEETQGLLDDKTTLLYYYTLLGASGSLAFVITHDHVSVVELPEATPEQLGPMVDTLRGEGSPFDSKPLVNLHTWLIAPLQAQLNTPQIAIVPYQQLHYVPFAALQDGQTYLSDKYALSVLPSTSIIPLIQNNARRALDQGEAPSLVMGDPAVPEKMVLDNAAEEARVVGEVVNAPVYIGIEATESLFYEQAPQAHLIHLAAHGVYSKTSPLDSAIYLAADGVHDGVLRVREIYNLDLAANKLIVLSACETNVGEPSGGDEVVGLSRAFFTAGSPAIISTLWRVDDAATAKLMESFYRHWQQEGFSKAQALQAAQAEIRANSDSALPYYWAAFVLNGDPGF